MSTSTIQKTKFDKNILYYFNYFIIYIKYKDTKYIDITLRSCIVIRMRVCVTENNAYFYEIIVI